MNPDSIYSFLRGGGLVLFTKYNRFTCDVADTRNAFHFTVVWLPTLPTISVGLVTFLVGIKHLTRNNLGEEGLL